MIVHVHGARAVIRLNRSGPRMHGACTPPSSDHTHRLTIESMKGQTYTACKHICAHIYARAHMNTHARAGQSACIYVCACACETCWDLHVHVLVRVRACH